MQRKSRLAVFEHVPHKERPNSGKTASKSLKRSLEYEDQPLGILKRRRKSIRSATAELLLNCEYDACSYSTDRYNDLLKHLIEHIDESADCPDEDGFDCLWEDCDFTGTNYSSLKQHVLYHGYHIKLVGLGNNMLNKLRLPDCSEVNVFKIPTLPPSFECEWDFCQTRFISYQEFLDHVKCHINSTPKKCVKKDDVIKCAWTGCTTTWSTQYKLAEHMKCHTKEKVIACPKCGVMFSCNTKFYDHRKRQLASDLQGYQCAQCSKQFASERLLRDHMRNHINHYKCHLCDMTCTKPSNLALHIRYRHLPDRVFKCDICGHSATTKKDLMTHIESHSNEFKMECVLCDFKCRSQYSMQKHIMLHEGKWGHFYACHCCDKRFPKGYLLTKHLIKVHDFHWPSGHSRFSYKKDTKSGLYYLQVVRYESLEVTQEMMESTVPYQYQIDQDLQFECEQMNTKLPSFKLKVACVKETEDDPSAVKEKNEPPKKYKMASKENKGDVLITIEDVDSSGNVVKVEQFESAKIFYASQVDEKEYYDYELTD